MAAAGRNFSRPKNQNASRKQPVPVPRARPVTKDQFSSKNSAAENIYNNLNGSDDNASPLSQLDYSRSKLQKKISQQESQQARFLAASEILKLDIQFFPKYKVVDLWKMLKENEGTLLELYLETFDILERYACSLLKPEEMRHKSWRTISFSAAVYQKIQSVKTVHEILNSLGYVQKMIVEGKLCGLTFPPYTTVNRSIVLEIATDLSLAKFELEAIKKESHPRIDVIVNDPLFPKSLLPRKVFARSPQKSQKQQKTLEVRKPVPPVTCVNSPYNYTYSHITSTTPLGKDYLPTHSSLDQPINYVFSSSQNGSISDPLQRVAADDRQISNPSSSIQEPIYEEIPDGGYINPEMLRRSFKSPSMPPSKPVLKTIYCHMCGKDCGEIANFCPQCGAQLNRNLNQSINTVPIYNHHQEVRSASLPDRNEVTKNFTSEKSLAPEEKSWTCENCTFINIDLETNICEMCSRTSDGFKPIKQTHNPKLQQRTSRQPMSPDFKNGAYVEFEPFEFTNSPKDEKPQPNLDKAEVPKKKAEFVNDKLNLKSEKILTKRQQLEKKKMEELKEKRQMEVELQKTEQLVAAIKACDNKGYDPKECIFAANKKGLFDSNELINWLEDNRPALINDFIEYCCTHYQGEFNTLLEVKEAQEIFTEAGGDNKEGFDIFINKRQNQMQELLEDYDMFVEKDILSVLCDNGGDTRKAKNKLTTELILMKDRHFFDDLLQPQIPNDGEDDEEYSEILMDENISNEFKTYLLMGEFDLSWGRAEMCLSLIREGKGVMSVVRAVQDSHDVHRVRANLGKECKICFQSVSIYETITSTYCQCQICWDCYANYLEHHVKNSEIEGMVCPSCGQPEMHERPRNYFEFIEQQIIYLVREEKLEQNVLEIFSGKLRDYSLKSDPNFRWCKFCEHGFIWDEPQRLQATCNRCNNSFCFQCGEDWEPQHEDTTCEQFKAWKEANYADQGAFINNLIGNNQLVCPKCGNRFDLAHGGCMHFTCSSRACRFEFCSGCFQEMIKVPTGQQCPYDERCTKNGLHGHHPRDCLYYLRDYSIENLKQLLAMSNVEYETEIPEYKQEEIQEAGIPDGTCYIRTTEETEEGMRDVPCGRQSGRETAGLCEKHAKEHLTYLINLNHIDPIDILRSEELKPIFLRHFLQTPAKLGGESDDDYTKRLRQLLQETVPLLVRDRNQSLPKLI